MAAACIVAVVVAYHPNSTQLTQLLARLAPQVAHTVCVDNTDGLPAATLQPDARSTRLQLGHNAGIAHAQNLGMAEARQRGATHVLLMDQDSLPPPDLVASLLRALADTDASPIAAIGPLCRDEKTGRLMPLLQREGWRIRRSVPPVSVKADTSMSNVSPSACESGAHLPTHTHSPTRAAPQQAGPATSAQPAITPTNTPGLQVQATAAPAHASQRVGAPQPHANASPALIHVEYIPASGTLLSLAAYDRVGPLQADYFIDRVDVQWCLRARQLGLAICVAPKVELAHNQATRTVRLLGRTLYVGHDFRAYFHVRNSLAMALRAPIPTFWRIDQLLKLPAYMALHIAVAQHGRGRMAGLMASAVWDGLCGHMGLGRFKDRPLR